MRAPGFGWDCPCCKPGQSQCCGEAGMQDAVWVCGRQLNQKKGHGVHHWELQCMRQRSAC